MARPTLPAGPILLDTNVLIHSLARRAPPALRLLLEGMPRLTISGPSLAELAWVLGRLDPGHPGTARVLALYEGLLARIQPANVLVPDVTDWREAGVLAGQAARSVAGGGKRLATAFDRVDLVSDAVTALVALKGGFTVVTEDTDFAVLATLLPGLNVWFYERVG